jgi:hypothetical protein
MEYSAADYLVRAVLAGWLIMLLGFLYFERDKPAPRKQTYRALLLWAFMTGVYLFTRFVM